MTPRTRRSVTWLLVLAIVIIPAQLFVVRAFSAPTLQDRAGRWALSLSDAGRRNAIDSIHALPIAYRHALRRTLTPKEQTALWSHHIAAYMAQETGLVETQKRFLLDAIAQLDAGALIPFQGLPSTENMRAVDAVDRTARSLFNREQARYLFHDLGPADADSAVREPGLNRISALIGVYFMLEAAARPVCECSVDSDYCSSGKCRTPTSECIIQNPICPDGGLYCGCGTFLLYTCDGMCLTSEE